MEKAIQVQNLSKKYNDFELKEVSFTLPKGMILGFIGENGAGKTTTIKALLQLISYTGNITFYGKNPKEQKIMDEIGVVLDQMFFPEILTPKDIHSIFSSIYKNWNSKLYFSYLEKFHIPKNKVIKKLSTGTRKKLEIVTSLSHEPKLLILDEPTSGLDPIARNEILDLFREFVENGENSILFSTHITSDLENLADYIVFIQNGQTLLSKSYDEILNSYAIAKCKKEEFEKIKKEDYLKFIKNKYDYELLIEKKELFQKKYTFITIDPINLEELMIFLKKGEENL